MRPTIAEPAVTITDYLLALETGLFAVALARRGAGRGTVRRAGAAFFGATSVGALLGGTVHGFFPDARQPARRPLWRATLLAIGTGALAAWALAARIGFPPRRARRLTALALLPFALYCAVVLGVTQRFLVAILASLPASGFLLAVFARRYARGRERPVGLGLVGIALTFVAAGVQQGRFALHPRYCDHNTLYHLIEGVAFLLFFAGLRGIEAPAGAADA